MSNLVNPQALLSADTDVPLSLGPKASVIGWLAFPGQANIQGRLEGEIKADKILVSRGGTITGTVIATVVTIEGIARDALIFADNVILRDGSTVTGEIWHKELVLEAGHLFEGKSRRHEDPRSLAPAPPPSSEDAEPFDDEAGDVIATA
jgi:cytoskeletal protein CcmA (bactofilin family)